MHAFYLSRFKGDSHFAQFLLGKSLELLLKLDFVTVALVHGLLAQCFVSFSKVLVCAQLRRQLSLVLSR